MDVYVDEHGNTVVTVTPAKKDLIMDDSLASHKIADGHVTAFSPSHQPGQSVAVLNKHSSTATYSSISGSDGEFEVDGQLVRIENGKEVIVDAMCCGSRKKPEERAQEKEQRAADRADRKHQKAVAAT